MPRLLTTRAQTTTHLLTNTSGTLYTIPVRVRFRATLKAYVGGTLVQPYVRKDAMAPPDETELISLVVNNPSATYYLNDATIGSSPDIGVFVDYMVNIVADGGALLTLTIDSMDFLIPSDVVIGGDAVRRPDIDQFDNFPGVFCQLDFDTTYEVSPVSSIRGGGVVGFKFAGFSEDVLIVGAEK